MMHYELSIIGSFHTNHNEDAYLITEIGNNHILLAVTDGCSMGKESHFASTLITKILRKISTEISYKTFLSKRDKSTEEYLLEILERLFQELKFLKNHLLLEVEEILSTLILGILNPKEKQAELITIGDGLICCNGALYEYEQDDKPDYLGYHLAENFNTWFQKQEQQLSLKQVEDLSISTDGIFTFKKFDNKAYESIQEEEIAAYFLIDRQWEGQANMFRKKLSEIERIFGLRPSDDLTILRIINV
jgi:hypothetical protein